MPLKGLNVFKKEIQVFSDQLAHGAAKEVADEMLEIARRIVPVDTGKLKANLNTEIAKIPNGYRVILYVDLDDVEYAIYVELGTVKMQAQPYVGPATLMAFEKVFK
jgi:HK97 gp10 family phage protein